MNDLLAIALLLIAIAVVVWRLPRVDLGHSSSYRRRRFFNWFPVGLTYAFLYMGRYNLNVCGTAVGDAMMSKHDFSDIFSLGSATYGLAFFLNGPLTDRLGGRITILMSAIGSAGANLAMGLVMLWRPAELVPAFKILYCVNMYFQSFGAVSIVKINAPWFHYRERGVFGGIFGILISLGLYFAYDWNEVVVKHSTVANVFFVPAAILVVMAGVVVWVVRDVPSQAGHADFDPGDATRHGEPRQGALSVAAKMFTNPIIVTIALVELCSGYLRNAIMQYYRYFAKDTGLQSFVSQHWGMMSCVAGILGGVFAGVISDRFFHSRRGPVSAILYGGMVVGAGAMYFLIDTPGLGWVLMFMSICIIGVHGMLSGTAGADFGGKHNAGIAVGIIDGFVYFGSALQGVVMGRVLPMGASKADPNAWWTWPVAIMPAAVIGLVLALRVWNAKPTRQQDSTVGSVTAVTSAISGGPPDDDSGKNRLTA